MTAKEQITYEVPKKASRHTNKYLKLCTAQNRSTNRQTWGIRNCICGIQNNLWHPQTNNKTCVCLLVESANFKWNYHFVCEFHLSLRNSLTVAESRTTSHIYLLRHPQQNKCADKFYATGFCTRNPRNFCRWNPLTFWNMFKDLSLESRNIQTQNCTPMQCTIWPR